MYSAFSIKESLRFGWHTLRTHSALLFKGVLALFAVEVLYSVVTAVTGPETLQGLLAAVVLGATSVFVGVGFTLITLKLTKGEQAHFRDIGPPAVLVLQYVVAALLAGLAVIAGLFLLIIPGIYLALRFSMMRFTVLEGHGVLGSLRKSAELTHGVKWQLLGFFIVIILLNILGVLLLLVGLLITIPVTMVAYAHVYEKLKVRSGKKL